MPSLLGAVGAAALVAGVGVVSAPLAATGASGPSVVEAPIEGSLEVRPAAGWRFADCGPLLAAGSLVTHCSPESFTVTGPAYDPGIEPVRVPVPLSNGTTTVTVDYVIRLAEPTPPDAPDTTLGMPLPAGAVSLVPLSELGLSCGRCSPGAAEVELRGTSRRDLGSARVTGTHLVFAAAPDARGRVEVDLRVRDDIGNASKTFKALLDVSPTTETSFRGLHLARAAGPVDLEVDELLLEPSDAPVTIADCGPALHGTVSCAPDGTVAYAPPAGEGSTAEGGTGGDQFAVRLVSADGAQTLASVTLGASDTGSGAEPELAPAAGSDRAGLAVPLPRPIPEDETEEPAGGATSGFGAILDALGAR